MQDDQAGIREKLAGLDQRLAGAPAPPVVTPAPVAPVAPAPPVEKPSVASIAVSPITPAPSTAQVPPPRVGLASKLPAIGEGPRKSSATPKPPEAKPAKPGEGVGDLAKLDVPLPKLPPTKPKTRPLAGTAPSTPGPNQPAPNQPAAEPAKKPAEQGKSRPALTEQQHARLIKRLRAHPQHTIIIRAEAGDPHSVELGMALRAAFRDAGWDVATVQLDSKRAPFPGLSLSAGTFPPPKEFVAAFGALEAAGFRVASNLDPHQGSQRVVLSVGAKR
jgi:hypothetical protein